MLRAGLEPAQAFAQGILRGNTDIFLFDDTP